MGSSASTPADDTTMLMSPTADDVWELLQNEMDRRNVGETSRVVITNESPYHLVYKDCGNIEGWFFHEPSTMTFRHQLLENEKSIPPKNTAGFLHTKTAGVVRNSSGWVSMTIRAEGKNYVVVFGFNTRNHVNTRSAGLQIRGEDGVMDGCGNITGHGVDPSGTVTDPGALVSHYHHSQRDDAWHTFNENCRNFRCTVKFTNEKHARYHLAIQTV